MTQSTNRYEVGPGANVSSAFKSGEYASWLRNEFKTDFFDNLALQQTIYQAIVQTMGVVAPSVSQKVTWNYNILPNIPGNYQAFNAPEDIIWDNEGNLRVDNYSMLTPDRSDYLISTSEYPNISVPYALPGMLSSTPLKQGKFYVEVEILEDTNYYFMLAPVGWESVSLHEIGAGSIAAIGAYSGAVSGRGLFQGLKYVGGVTTLEHSNVLVAKENSFTKHDEPFQAGDILQFAYDTDVGVAFLGMNGIYARWNVASSYTTMDGTNANTGILIGGNIPPEQKTFALFAVPFQKHPDRSFMTDQQANCNVRILTGNACNYSPPVGYTDH